MSLRFQADPCEWNPDLGRPAHVEDVPHGDAAVSLDNGTWHLCTSCAALPAFDRFTVRKPLRQAGGTV